MNYDPAELAAILLVGAIPVLLIVVHVLVTLSA